jgi:DNA mismatch endonuclease (patch repair protein)
MMAGIKGKNTKPELLVRSFLHSKGLRYRCGSKKLPGKPDIVLPKYNSVVFVHGCFWHRHGCKNFVWPKTRVDFWREKLNSNVARDRRSAAKLRRLGWHVHTVWECRLSDGQLNMLYKRIISNK